ncbi:hypothetical protein AGR3A_Lc160203 [Agrobacterium tomkonis CFBP 6623]|uniref:Uncharacterized protein n=1 Tax=Agrobacterium tomkonis CFBP 6623 TaxID=1183432 RepID=A0A1S7S041_9HYPH|nr:hypothetical protein AGR3A_Lc160203 [Agrobacterium tomkonis CFBP 6623]
MDAGGGEAGAGGVTRGRYSKYEAAGFNLRPLTIQGAGPLLRHAGLDPASSHGASAP